MIGKVITTTNAIWSVSAVTLTFPPVPLFAALLDKLPKAVLLYNGGVKLSSEGSDSIEDLKALEEKGVEILSCGTCLNFYNLQDKLKVGKVTNMYSIVEEMTGATNIVRP